MSAQKREPFLPLFFGDFLGATGTWDGEEQALYLLLLGYQWSAGPLPTDPKRLARMVRYDIKHFLELWQVVGKKFAETAAGLVNQRLEEHRQRSQEISSKRSAIGKEGAEAKWKQKPPGAHSKWMANAIGLPPQEVKQKDAIQTIPSDTKPNQTMDCSLRSQSETRAREPSPEQILAEYPATPNGNRASALHRIAALIDSGEATGEQLLEGTRRFRNFVDAGGRSDASKVQGPEKFYGKTLPDQPAPWSMPWTPPPTKADKRLAGNLSAAEEFMRRTELSA